LGEEDPLAPSAGAAVLPQSTAELPAHQRPYDTGACSVPVPVAVPAACPTPQKAGAAPSIASEELQALWPSALRSSTPPRRGTAATLDVAYYLDEMRLAVERDACALHTQDSHLFKQSFFRRLPPARVAANGWAQFARHNGVEIVLRWLAALSVGMPAREPEGTTPAAGAAIARALTVAGHVAACRGRAACSKGACRSNFWRWWSWR
jgi:hypothetical protein